MEIMGRRRRNCSSRSPLEVSNKPKAKMLTYSSVCLCLCVYIFPEEEEAADKEKPEKKEKQYFFNITFLRSNMK